MHQYTEQKRTQYSLVIDGIKVARGSGTTIIRLAYQIRDKYPSTNLQITKG